MAEPKYISTQDGYALLVTLDNGGAVSNATIGAVDDAAYTDATGDADGTVITLLKGLYVQNAAIITLLTAIEANTSGA